MSTPAAARAMQKGRRPRNVLFLMSDQHKPGALGIDGHPVARTPHLDALAREGVRFSNAYCSNPICGPARASMWTGRYAHNHGVLANEMPYPVGTTTIAHSFRRAGYNTAAIGKMHFADAGTHGFDYRLDFNDWYQYLGPQARIFADEVGRPFPGDGHPQIRSLWPAGADPWAGSYEKDGRAGMTHVGRVSKLAEKDHFESFVVRESVEYLRRFAGKQPFFLVASFLKPHQPFMPAERFAAMFKAEDMRLPRTHGKVDLARTPQFIRKRISENPLTPELLDPVKALQRIASYYAVLAQMDDCVGALLKALREMGLDDDTAVVYTSDHGELLGEHSLWQKFVFYESSVKAPLIMRVPGLTGAGQACSTPVSHVQLAPTLAELCGVPSLASYDGASLVDLLRNPAEPRQTRVFAEYDLSSQRPKYMIRRGQWKYCHYKDDMPEMFDLASDPDEMHNLAADPAYQARAGELRSALAAWHPRSLDSLR